MNAIVLGNTVKADSTKIQELRGYVLQTKRDISQSLLKSADNHCGTDGQSDLLNTCLAGLQGIGASAQELGMDNLWCLCADLVDYLGSLQNDPQSILMFGYVLQTWSTNIVAYLDQPDNTKLAEKLFAPLPQDRRQRMLDGWDTSFLKPTSNDDTDKVNFFVSDEESEEMLAKLADAEPQDPIETIELAAAPPIDTSSADEVTGDVTAAGLIVDDDDEILAASTESIELAEEPIEIDIDDGYAADEIAMGLITDDSDEALQAPIETIELAAAPPIDTSSADEVTDDVTAAGLIVDDDDEILAASIESIELAEEPIEIDNDDGYAADEIAMDLITNDCDEEFQAPAEPTELAENLIKTSSVDESVNDEATSGLITDICEDDYVGDDIAMGLITDDDDGEDFSQLSIESAEPAENLVNTEISDTMEGNDPVIGRDGNEGLSDEFWTTDMQDTADTVLNDLATASMDQFDPILAFGVEESAPDPDDLLGVLSAELADVTGQLAEFQQILTSIDEPDALQNAKTQYIEIVQRLMGACDALGLTGLFDICAFVQVNTSGLTSLPLIERQNLSDHLATWPSLVLAYLRDPTDDPGCLALVDHFQDDNWPAPLQGNRARDLYMSLTHGMTALEDLEEAEARQTTALAEDVLLEISPDAGQDLLDAFFYEAPTHTENLNACVAHIANGEDLLDNILRAQRLAHTLKGAANLVGAKGIANLTHHIEDIFEYLANHHIVPPEPLAILLQEAADCLEAMVEALQGTGQPPEDALDILQRVLNWANRVDNGQIRQEDQISSLYRPAPPEGESETGDTAEQADRPHTTANSPSNQDVTRVPSSTVDEMLRLVGEVSISMGQVQEQLTRAMQWKRDMRNQETTLQQRRFELENLVDIHGLSSIQRHLHRAGTDVKGFDSLEMDHYDELYSTAHAYIEAVTDNQELSMLIQKELDSLDHIFIQQQRLNKQLQQIVATTRMAKVNSIGSRLHRAVRQAARATHKQVELQLQGAEILIDTDVLNKLIDPLMHMLRNAVDHGIESPEQRKRLGKPIIGKVIAGFGQEGNDIIIRCEDDGSGMDFDAIRDTAIRKGLIDTAAELDNKDISRLILIPGFSTRTTTTQISGRGVGMDVVHNTIQELKGTLDIGQNETGGTVFSIRLPITLIANHCLVVKIGNQQFAIPSQSLNKIVAPGSGQFNKEGDTVIYKLDDNSYPIKNLGMLVGMSKQEINDNAIILLASVDDETIALAVDQVINNFDLVIKNTGQYLNNIPGISGVALLGDGSVIPVLDIANLVRNPAQIKIGDTTINTTVAIDTSTAVRHVLIVDDSLSVRKTLSQLVEDAGYNAILARDGVEAMELLQKHPINLAIVDMEMPRMNGLELTQHIRGSADLKNLPVIMITSRSQNKHRQQAKIAGVNEYLTKPYHEDELSAKIDELIDN